MKAKQEHYYNQSAKPLPELNPGNTIRIRILGDNKWTRGVCKEKVGPRSFEVEANGAIYRRTQSQLIETEKEDVPDLEEFEPPTLQQSPAPFQDATIEQTDPLVSSEQPARRSARQRKPQVWAKDYIT